LDAKRKEVTGKARKLHNEERNDLYALPTAIRVIKSSRERWAGHVACMGEKRFIQIIKGKPERKKPLGKPSRKWEDNI